MLIFSVSYNDIELPKIKKEIERLHINMLSSEIVSFIRSKYDDLFDDIIYIRYDGELNNLRKLISFSSGDMVIRNTIYQGLSDNGFHDYLSHSEGYEPRPKED
ncbi:MAG: hypothetical protein H6550_09495 [Chitinophagales bacterium]|nr:hypothetical protein [Chitinophagales bacterium]